MSGWEAAWDYMMERQMESRRRLMVGQGLAGMAALAALGAVDYGSAPGRSFPAEPRREPPAEEISRQRKRWLQRQARKTQRLHRK